MLSLPHTYEIHLQKNQSYMVLMLCLLGVLKQQGTAQPSNHKPSTGLIFHLPDTDIEKR